MSKRQLYRVEVLAVGYVYAENETAARKFAPDVVDDRDDNDIEVDLVQGGNPSGTWNEHCLVWTDGSDEIRLGDVWPND